jgi:hypothetical protein
MSTHALSPALATWSLGTTSDHPSSRCEGPGYRFFADHKASPRSEALVQIELANLEVIA